MDNHIIIEENDGFLYYLYKAVNTIWYFDRLVESGFDGYNSIKFKSENGVFVWLENIGVDGDHYRGIIVETGEQKIIYRSEAVDWMIIESQRMIGGYTIRHYFNMLSEDEKVNFQIDCGYSIDHGNDFFKADRSTAEGAIITLENFYNERNVEGILSCKDFYWEAKNVLFENNIKFDTTIHSKIESALKVSLLEELERNGFPNFENIERVFSLLEKREDQVLIEEKLIYPDGFVTVNKFWVALTKEGWKVLNLIE